jgi:formamidopyrimidine-DNA glycosylase
VRPDKKIEKLTNVEIKKLYSSIQKVIKKAIEQRGTTFNDYVDSEGKSGYFGKFLKVYARAGLKCKRCSGIIEKIKLTGRGTHFCPKCQK